MLRRTQFATAAENIVHQTRVLPSRLTDWRLAEDGKTFAYAGDEVDLSVWDTDLAFSTQTSAPATAAPTKKRKRNEDLFPGEIWRARNVLAFIPVILVSLSKIRELRSLMTVSDFVNPFASPR